MLSKISNILCYGAISLILFSMGHAFTWQYWFIFANIICIQMVAKFGEE